MQKTSFKQAKLFSCVFLILSVLYNDSGLESEGLGLEASFGFSTPSNSDFSVNGGITVDGLGYIIDN